MAATRQVLKSHMWLMATKLESTDYGTFPSWQSVLLDRSDPDSPFQVVLVILVKDSLRCCP